jgi:hypothetical protein
MNNYVCKDGDPARDKGAMCHEFHEWRIGTRENDAKRLGVPLLITEFGACLGSDLCAREINSVADVCEKDLIGWSYW